MAIGRDRAGAGQEEQLRRSRTGRFAEAPHDRTPDQVDVVLAEWASERPEQGLAPVAFTARISRLAQILQQRMERTLSRFGLDWGQFLVLVALRGSGTPFRMSPRELHRLLLLSPAAVTNRLYRLEAKGLIERVADPSDRRSLPVLLTPLGLSAVERAMAACLEVERDLLAGGDPDEMAVTLTTIRRLLAAYEEYPARRSGRRGLALAVEAVDPDLADAIEQAEAAAAQVAPPEPLAWWPDTHRELERLQRKLARHADEAEAWSPRESGTPAVGGVFVSLPTVTSRELRDLAWAAAVVMEGSTVVATATATRRLERSYQPGYLGLAVGPVLEDVVHALAGRPDLILVNAAGRDHERGAGLAIQLGAALDIPTVGVTESPNVGHAPEPGTHRGDWTPVRIDNRLVGFRLRTQSRASAITAHAGWRTTPEVAREVVLRTTGRGRVPEPIQRARQLSRRLRSEHERSASGGLQDGIHP
jgi:deoxyribonuclease V